MERVAETFTIKQRGPVAVIKLESPIQKGDRVRRTSDGAVWTVLGIEYFLHRAPRAGDVVGVLLEEGAAPLIGDELDRV